VGYWLNFNYTLIVKLTWELR